MPCFLSSLSGIQPQPTVYLLVLRRASRMFGVINNDEVDQRLIGIRRAANERRVSRRIPQFSARRCWTILRRSFLRSARRPGRSASGFEWWRLLEAIFSRQSPTGSWRRRRYGRRIETDHFAIRVASGGGRLSCRCSSTAPCRSIRSATRRGNRSSRATINVARRVAEQIRLYVQTNVNILQSVVGKPR